MPGEFDFINWIRNQPVGLDGSFVRIPPGDDLAALAWPSDDLLLVGVDQVLDGVHFDGAIHPPRDIGRKAMNRNLSDCAAMACLPAAAVATVALPRGAGMDYAKQLYLGLRDAADLFGCPVVGGDTGTWDGKLVLTVTILGRSAGVPPVARRGAKPGDSIYVTGPLGGSILGRHMTFAPRVALARELVQAGEVTAMLDLSDGLARDLGHICREGGVRAVLDAGSIPIHNDARKLSETDGVTALQHALSDGEDYELLFTGNVPNGRAIRVGRIVEGEGIFISGDSSEAKVVPLSGGGWEHQLPLKMSRMKSRLIHRLAQIRVDCSEADGVRNWRSAHRAISLPASVKLCGPSFGLHPSWVCVE